MNKLNGNNKIYIKSLKPISSEEIIDLILYRPIAFKFVKLISNSKITPNMITLTGMLWGITAGYLLSKTDLKLFFIGVILTQIANIFDCMDGQLARLKNMFSIFGRILDGFVDYINFTAIYIGAYFHFLKINILPHRMLFLLFIVSSISTIITSIVYDRIKNRFISFIKRGNNIDKELEKIKILIKNSKGVINIFYKIYYHYSIIQANTIRESKFPSPDEASDSFVNEFIKQNELIIKFWSFVGPSTHIFLFFIFSIIKKPILYFWFISTVLNIIFFLLILAQFIIDRKLLKIYYSSIA